MSSRPNGFGGRAPTVVTGARQPRQGALARHAHPLRADFDNRPALSHREIHDFFQPLKLHLKAAGLLVELGNQRCFVLFAGLRPGRWKISARCSTNCFFHPRIKLGGRDYLRANSLILYCLRAALQGDFGLDLRGVRGAVPCHRTNFNNHFNASPSISIPRKGQQGLGTEWKSTVLKGEETSIGSGK